MQPRPPDRSKVRALIAEAEHVLAAGPHPDRARRDAEELLLQCLRSDDPDRNRAWLIAHADSPTTPNIAPEMSALVQRRLKGEPIQYITGETEFYGLPFRVTPDVLIPRPETEHLVEKAIEIAATQNGLVTGRDFSRAERGSKRAWALAPAESTAGFPRILDVGTGSGAIAVALAHHLPHAHVSAVDISTAALGIARENARRNAVENRIRFLESDLLASVAQEKFDIVVSNPPYVSAADRDTLAIEVRDHEPALALFAGGDGLDAVRRLIPAAYAVLEPGGFLLIEIGYGQSPPVGALLKEAGFERVNFVPDLQGISRVAFGQRPA